MLHDAQSAIGHRDPIAELRISSIVMNDDLAYSVTAERRAYEQVDVVRPAVTEDHYATSLWSARVDTTTKIRCAQQPDQSSQELDQDEEKTWVPMTFIAPGLPHT
jgi:hypothetical protein